jgi:oxygen-independent coproporphyrinogen-3 oxidase
MSTTFALPVAPAAPSGMFSEPYEAYSYSYPHKSAYGQLDPVVSLEPLWQAEDRKALFLYFHVPFCEMRCGFCNLFARAGADQVLVDDYLDALERQAKVMAAVTAPGRAIARLAIGGGTPTFLSASQLERLFRMADRYFDARPSTVPTSVETSPKTATRERLEVLRLVGVERISIGVQSFVDEEVHAIGRPQTASEVHAALELLRDFPLLNIDLIYGQPTQTVASWLVSLRTALRYRPEEIFIYPLYVRPSTGIGRHGDVQGASSSFTRLLYREARDFLLAAGYEQISMRCFRAGNVASSSGPVYCCQTDGMLGLGCGARSYTSQLHYSSRFAVESAGVQTILTAWMGQTEADFACADWGVRLSEEDSRRRFVIQSLLSRPGLVENDFRRIYAEAVVASFPDLTRLLDQELVERSEGVWRLTALGFELSDAIGPSLYSVQSRDRLREFTRR